jgi:hypothetical protein
MSGTRGAGSRSLLEKTAQTPGKRSESWNTRRRRRPCLELLETRQLLSTYAVTNTNDSGAGSLRQAMLDANASGQASTIEFDIPASTAPLLNVPVAGFDPTTQTWTITLNTPLPAITTPISIDGYSEAHSGVPYRYPNAVSSAVQQLSVTGSPTGGTFTLTTAAPLPVGTTVAIPYNASAGTIQAALGAIVGLANVSVTGGPAPDSSFSITFQNTYAGMSIPDLVGNSSLTGGTNPGVVAQTTTAGGTATQDPVYIKSVPNSVAARSGDNARARIIIDGHNTSGATGFVMEASHATLRGLIITGFQTGVSVSSLDTSGNPVLGDLIQGNFIGDYFLYPVDTSTGAALPSPNSVYFTYGRGNLGVGIVLNSSNTTVGGSNPQENNVICGNGLQGILIRPGASGNQVVGNQIGMAGPSDNGLYSQDGNGQEGVLILSSGSASDPPNIVYASSNFIGTAPGGSTNGGNVISGNGASGVRIVGVGAIRNLVQGNYIGVAPGGGYLFGTGNPGNSGDGVRLEDAGQNQIGGSTSALGNVIASNSGAGIYITGSSATGNTVANNRIGVTDGGSQVLGNALEGIALHASNNTVGPGNVISQNMLGIGIYGPEAGNILVQDNLIGTDGSGELYGFGNAKEGILISGSSANTIQGNAAGSQVISGNQIGISIQGASSTKNLIQGNFIGSDETGKSDLGNKLLGILLTSTSDNTVGGTSSSALNLIAANHTGIQFDGATQNLVEGNLIGTDITGTAPLSNEVLGVLFTNNASNNSIGGLSASLGNSIAFHSQAGISVVSGTGDSFLTNSIWANGRLGIDLVAPGDPISGVTPNAPGVRSGPNNLQNYPVLTTAVGGTSGTIQGTLNSIPSTSFLIQFFSSQVPDPSGYGQGQKWIGSTTVTTDANGNASFSYTPSGGVPGSLWITGTATNTQTGDTSEFSNAVSSDPVGLEFLSATETVSATSGTAVIHVERTGNPNAVVSVHYATSNGTAVAGKDYQATSGTLTFQVGETDKTFSIAILPNPNQSAASTTVNLTLSQPTGGSTLGSIPASVLTINNNLPPSVQFASTSYSAYVTQGTATVTVTRGGDLSTAVQVHYTTAGGTASPGVDYTPTAGTLTFLANQTIASFAVPILKSSSATSKTLGLVLSGPSGGAQLGTPAVAALTLMVNPYQPVGPVDTVPPQVVGEQLVLGGGGIAAVVFQFSKPLDPAKAVDLGNYGYFAILSGLDGVIGSSDDGFVPLASAQYSPSADAVALFPATPIPLNGFARITINGVANPVLGRGLTDTSGNLLSGLGNGVPGSPYISTFGVGTSLTYVDGSGKTVNLSLSGGGVMEMFRTPSGEVQSLSLIGAVPRKSVLNLHANNNGSRYTSIPPIQGGAGVRLRYRTPPFRMVRTAPGSTVVNRPARRFVAHRPQRTHFEQRKWIQ